jgi:hypothetical protein
LVPVRALHLAILLAATSGVACADISEKRVETVASRTPVPLPPRRDGTTGQPKVTHEVREGTLHVAVDDPATCVFGQSEQEVVDVKLERHADRTTLFIEGAAAVIGAGLLTYYAVNRCGDDGCTALDELSVVIGLAGVGGGGTLLVADLLAARDQSFREERFREGKDRRAPCRDTGPRTVSVVFRDQSELRGQLDHDGVVHLPLPGDVWTRFGNEQGADVRLDGIWVGRIQLVRPGAPSPAP